MFLRHRRPALDTMFAPESVALIGTTEAPGSVGRALVEKPEVIPRTHLSGESKARKDNFQIHNLVVTLRIIWHKILRDIWHNDGWS